MQAKNGSVVLCAHAGGLGDQLIYSTLPELYARRGFDVYVSDFPPIRNAEVKDLVWSRNPFVSGFTGQPATAGAPLCAVSMITEAKQHPSIISAIEKLHDFVPVNMLPKLYYVPKFRTEWHDRVVADASSFSQPIEPQVFDTFLAEASRWENFRLEDVVMLDSKHVGPWGKGGQRGCERYTVADIFEYVDIIFSSRIFCVAESGGQVLASAIKGNSPFPKVLACFTTMSMNDRLFTFPNVQYHVTGRMTPDYVCHANPLRQYALFPR